MSIELGKLGWWNPANKTSTRPQTVVLPTSSGTTLVCVAEFNDATAFAADAAYGDGSTTNRLKIWEVTSTGGSATLVFNTNLAPWGTPMDQFSADLFEDNSIAVGYVRGDTGAVAYRKITYGSWALGAQEVVATPPGVVQAFDISVSEADAVAIVYTSKNAANPKLTLNAAIRSTGGTWVSATAVNLLTGTDPDGPMTSVSAQWVKGGTSTARPLMFAACSAQSGAGAVDFGTKIYTAVANESTGALVNVTMRKNYLAGNMAPGGAYFPRRTYLFRTGTNLITVAHVEGKDNKTILVAVHTFDGNTWTESTPPQTSTMPASPTTYARFAASYAQNTVNFYYIQEFSGALRVTNVIAAISGSTVRFSGPFRWDNMEGSPDRVYPMAGTGKRSDSATSHRMVYFNRTLAGLWAARHHRNVAAPAPTEVTPSGGSAITGTPTLGLKIALGKAWPQSRHKAVWQFATDSAFSTSVKTYIQDDTKYTKIENTETAGSYVYFTDILPTSLSLSSGTWYVRAAMIDEFGNQGAWSSTGSSSLSHPPAATNLSPGAGVAVTDSVVTFSWTFTDPLATDTQSAFQVVVERNDTGVVVYDSTQVASGANTHLANLGSSLAGVLLRWKVMLWDSDNTAGAFSPYETFMIAGAPTVAINSPTPAATVASGTPAILFTPTVDGGRKIKAYQVTITQGGVSVKDSGRVSVNVDSGTQLSWRSPMPLLENGAYSATVTVVDQASMTSAPATVAFSISTVPAPSPSGLVVSPNNYNVEGAGYVQVYWSDAARDPNFEAWVIYRKDDLLGYGTTVVEEGVWKEAGQVTVAAAGTYQFRDYYAPSAGKSTYKVRQLVNRSGDRAFSIGEPIDSCYPSSYGYWLIEPVSATGVPLAFRLENVTADDYSPEYEQNEYIIIGRGRHVDEGDFLGVKGSLSAQLRNTDATTARQKKIQLEGAQRVESAVYIRNPFGDVIPVKIGNMNIHRIAGVGLSEFVDVDVPYSEVGM